VLGPDAHRRARHPEGEHLLSSCGQPFSGHDVRLVDDERRVVSTGKVGEIEVRSPDLMKAYWLNDDATRLVLNGGWL
jgi:long-subunit acyl-CoA synthetase (AMP-forming)